MLYDAEGCLGRFKGENFLEKTGEFFFFRSKFSFLSFILKYTCESLLGYHFSNSKVVLQTIYAFFQCFQSYFKYAYLFFRLYFKFLENDSYVGLTSKALVQ